MIGNRSGNTPWVGQPLTSLTSGTLAARALTLFFFGIAGAELDHSATIPLTSAAHGDVVAAAQASATIPISSSAAAGPVVGAASAVTIPLASAITADSLGLGIVEADSSSPIVISSQGEASTAILAGSSVAFTIVSVIEGDQPGFAVVSHTIPIGSAITGDTVGGAQAFATIPLTSQAQAFVGDLLPDAVAASAVTIAIQSDLSAGVDTIAGEGEATIRLYSAAQADVGTIDETAYDHPLRPMAWIPHGLGFAGVLHPLAPDLRELFFLRRHEIGRHSASFIIKSDSSGIIRTLPRAGSGVGEDAELRILLLEGEERITYMADEGPRLVALRPEGRRNLRVRDPARLTEIRWTARDPVVIEHEERTLRLIAESRTATPIAEDRVLEIKGALLTFATPSTPLVTTV